MVRKDLHIQIKTPTFKKESGLNKGAWPKLNWLRPKWKERGLNEGGGGRGLNESGCYVNERGNHK